MVQRKFGIRADTFRGKIAKAEADRPAAVRQPFQHGRGPAIDPEPDHPVKGLLAGGNLRRQLHLVQVRLIDRRQIADGRIIPDRKPDIAVQASETMRRR